ncbi:hypothetical protein DK389_12815 [Methylobacterium durans]|uniref:Uncharacterized protein n=1 Tax=Methylobacterium durans TaxID=2202825 RepID=A0A2U8W779_9HYPH|nr:hypothetical protein DK389_12815 [Methylobacterium durans]
MDGRPRRGARGQEAGGRGAGGRGARCAHAGVRKGARGAPAVTWTAGEAPAANCTRSRRKLWQEGEGWIVRTVTACR